MAATPYPGEGPIGVSTVHAPGAPIVGVRYRQRLNAATVVSQSNKIVFVSHGAVGAPGLYMLSCDQMLRGYTYQDQDTCQPFVPAGGTPWDAPGLWVRAETYDPSGRVGIQPQTSQTRAAFPRCEIGVDGMTAVTSIDGIYQGGGGGLDLLGADLAWVLWRSRKVTLAAPVADWGPRFVQNQCTPLLPAGDYWEWNVGLSGLNQCPVIHRWLLRVPGDQPYLSPCGIVTEFFELEGSRIQFYLWDCQVWLEGGAKWEPLTQWAVTYTANPQPPPPPWHCGVKIGSYKGQHVLEVSNDGTPTYAGPHQTLDLVAGTIT